MKSTCEIWNAGIWIFKGCANSGGLPRPCKTEVNITGNNLPYARHYKPLVRFVYFLPTCFQGGVFDKILFLCMASIQEQFVIKSGL